MTGIRGARACRCAATRSRPLLVSFLAFLDQQVVEVEVQVTVPGLGANVDVAVQIADPIRPHVALPWFVILRTYENARIVCGYWVRMLSRYWSSQEQALALVFRPTLRVLSFLSTFKANRRRRLKLSAASAHDRESAGWRGRE